MTTVYTTDDQLIYAGAVEIDPDGPLPPHSTLTAPPAVTGNQVALLDGSGWVVLASRPVRPPTVAPVPPSVTRRQGQLALRAVGKLDAAEAAIAAIVDPDERRDAQIEYEAGTWERGNPFLTHVWYLLGGSETELDDLFRLAVTL